MDLLIDVLLPLSLAVIMLSLGIGLTLSDFKRVAERGWAFVIGATFQLLFVPLTAYLIIIAFGLTGQIAAGVMLLAFCPGGATSNLITRLARGDVALSVSLTATLSLVSILTVPLLVGWAVVQFMGADAPEVSVTSLAIMMFLITTLPVAIGMLIRRAAPAFADRVESKLVIVASMMFATIILAALAVNWNMFLANIGTLGPALGAMIIVMMLAGLGLASLAGLTWKERKTVSIEVGIQNGTVGITLAPLIVGVSGSIPEIGLPSAVYGIMMYFVVLPFAAWLRTK